VESNVPSMSKRISMNASASAGGAAAVWPPRPGAERGRVASP
jgi:hypothetical protein